MKTAACIYQITSTTLCRVCWPTRVPPATVVGSGTSWCIRRERGRLFFYPPLAICMCLRGVSVCVYTKVKGRGRVARQNRRESPPPSSSKVLIVAPGFNFQTDGTKAGQDEPAGAKRRRRQGGGDTLLLLLLLFCPLGQMSVHIGRGQQRGV